MDGLSLPGYCLPQCEVLPHLELVSDIISTSEQHSADHKHQHSANSGHVAAGTLSSLVPLIFLQRSRSGSEVGVYKPLEVLSGTAGVHEIIKYLC